MTYGFFTNLLRALDESDPKHTTNISTDTENMEDELEDILLTIVSALLQFVKDPKLEENSK